jgi:hypothetical protein
MVVVWSKSAAAELKIAFTYISLDSLENARMVKDTLIDLTIDLAENPEKHPLDKFKKNNDGSWRAFQKISLPNFLSYLKKSKYGLYVSDIPANRRLLTKQLLKTNGRKNRISKLFPSHCPICKT